MLTLLEIVYVIIIFVIVLKAKYLLFIIEAIQAVMENTELFQQLLEAGLISKP